MDNNDQTHSNSVIQDDDEEDFQAPDGGWGWIVVGAAFVTNLIADGVTFTFGIIYVDLLKYFGQGKSQTAWIGGLFLAMPLLAGPVASLVTERWGTQKVCILGAILASLGFGLSAAADSLAVLVLTFGIISGLGLALCYVAAMVSVAYYFDKKRSFATGLSVCGSGVGTCVFAPFSAWLVETFGWRGTMLALAGIFLSIIICGLLMKDLDGPGSRTHSWSEMSSSTSSERESRINADNSPETTELLKQEIKSQALVSQCKLNGVIKQSDRPFNSLLNIPTFVKNSDKVPVEVFKSLSNNKDKYDVITNKYPSLLKDSLNNIQDTESTLVHSAVQKVMLTELQLPVTQSSQDICKGYLVKKSKSTLDNLRESQIHRLSLTYRGTVLNLKRRRMKASSCPNIFRLPTENQQEKHLESNWFSCISEVLETIRKMVDFSLFSNKSFLLFSISNFLLYFWYDVPYVFIADKAIEMGFSERDSSYLIGVLGITNTIGVVAVGWLGDKEWANPNMVYAACMAVCGIITSFVPTVSSYIGLCSLTGGFGLCVSANYALTSIILVDMINLDRFTNVYGLLLLVQGISNLVGPPMAGWMYDLTGSYDLPFYLAGFFIVLSGILLVVPSVFKWTIQFFNPQINPEKSAKHAVQTCLDACKCPV